MAHSLRVVAHLSLKELDAYIKQCKSALEIRRLLVIGYAQANASTSLAISCHTGFSAGRVRNLIHLYNKAGPPGLLDKKRKGSSSSHLSFEEEKKFISIRAKQ